MEIKANMWSLTAILVEESDIPNCATIYIAIYRMVYPILRCNSEVTSDQAIPDQSVQWSDGSALKTQCALEVISDQTLPDGNDLWSDRNRPLSRRLCVHGLDQTHEFLRYYQTTTQCVNSDENVVLFQENHWRVSLQLSCPILKRSTCMTCVGRRTLITPL